MIYFFQQPPGNTAMGAARVGPPDYIRRVRHGWQARPMRDGTRHNLGVFRTEWDARRAVTRFLSGRLEPLPKFVCKTLADPARYYWHVRLTNMNVRSDVMHDTPTQAATAVRAFLTRLDGLMGMVALASADGRVGSSRL